MGHILLLLYLPHNRIIITLIGIAVICPSLLSVIIFHRQAFFACAQQTSRLRLGLLFVYTIPQHYHHILEITARARCFFTLWRIIYLFAIYLSYSSHFHIVFCVYLFLIPEQTDRHWQGPWFFRHFLFSFIPILLFHFEMV